MDGGVSKKTADEHYSGEQLFTVCGLNTLIIIIFNVPFALFTYH